MRADLGDVLSVSRLSKLADCPEQYRRSYVEGNRGSQNVTTAAGTAVHTAAQWAEEARENGLDFDLMAATELAFKGTQDLSTLRVFGKKTVKWWLDQGIANLGAQYALLRQQDREQGLALTNSELHLEHELESMFLDERFTVQGYIDQVLADDDGWVIRDLKAGKPKPWHAMQLEVYMWLARMNHGEDVGRIRGQIAYLGGGDSPLKVEPVVPTMDDVGVAALMRGAFQQARALHRGAPAAMTGIFTDSCGLCDFRSSCPAGRVGQVSVELSL